MKTVTPFPTLDLAEFDAAIFNLDGVVLPADGAQNHVLGEPESGVFSSIVALARELKACHIKTALVTTRKNGLAWAKTTGLVEVFDRQVDGDSEVLLRATQRLGVLPGRSAVFEATPAGIQASRAGNFRVIVGFSPGVWVETLKIHGADIMVRTLRDLSLKLKNGLIKRNIFALPSGLSQRQDQFRLIDGKSIVVFLDYDGTLTPIVDRPELATLPQHMRATLKQLANFCAVGVISGRDRVTVQQMVDVDSLFYAGSHGFDISGPKNWSIQHEIGTQFLPVLDQLEISLHQRLDPIIGTIIERKKFSVAVHYRLVGTQDLATVREAVAEVLSQHPDIRALEGKKIFDLQPRIDWDKGKALVWLMEALNISCERTIPFYLGDDLTDEDAFRTIQDGGMGIIVEDSQRFTFATYRLKDPQEVDQYLGYLSDHLRSLGHG